MTGAELTALEKALDRLLREIGRGLIARRGAHDIHIKNGDPKDLVSDSDLWVQEALGRGLAYLLPEASFIAEEKENNALRGLTWIVDPIDGTSNYIQQERDYAISVALYEGETPLLGAVYDVSRDELFTAARGMGARRNGEALPPLAARPLEACFLDMSLGSMRVLSGRLGRPLDEINKHVRAHRSLGCASLSMALIAAGCRQIYVSGKLRPWDYAAARLLLAEVGGTVVPIFSEDRLMQAEATAILACDSPERAEQLLAQWLYQS